jgi:hypothetical protein
MGRRTIETHTRARHRTAASISVVAATVAAALLASACGSSIPTQSTRSPAQTALAYARCMRAHGDPSFPDPGSGGRIALNPSTANSPQFNTANATCRRLLPAGAAGPSGGGASPSQVVAALLKLARCMRAHGFPDFPDPSSNGQLLISPSSGTDPNSPQFKAANSYCARYLPGAGKAGALVSSSPGGRS